MHGVGVWHVVKKIFTMPVNLRISNVQFSLRTLHCLQCKVATRKQKLRIVHQYTNVCPQK